MAHFSKRTIRPHGQSVVALACGSMLGLAGLTLLACTSTPAPSSSAGPDAAPLAAGDASVECQPPPGRWDPSRDPPAHCVREVFGRVSDTAGAPLAATAVSVCGLACFATASTADGTFRVPINAMLPDNGYVLFAHGRPRHASLFFRLPTSPPERIEFAPFELATFSSATAPLPADDGPATTIDVGPLRFGVAAGTTWDLVFEDIADDVEGRVVRFAKVMLDEAPIFAKGASLVYALAPFEAKASKPVTVTIAEAGGLAAGAAVEFVVMQDGIVTADNTGGLPSVAATGHVSADGASISTDPGQGVQLFTWLAVRPAL